MIDKKILMSAKKSLEHPGKPFAPLPKTSTKKYPVLYVFRHGETYDNRNRVFSGWRQSRLTPRGVSQAEVLAKKLKSRRIDMAVQSRLVRSRQTLKIILKYHPKAKKENDDRIIERNYGKLNGRSKAKLMRKNMELAVKYRRYYNFPPPGGESIKTAEKRVFAFCRDMAKRMKREKINVALSAHSNSMRAVRRYFEKLSVQEMLVQENPLGVDYASYAIR